MGYAEAVISVPPEHLPGKVELPRDAPGDPEKHFTTREAAHIENKQVFLSRLDQNLSALPEADREIIVFIHGYNTRFPEALYRFTQFIHDLNEPAVPVLFTWASGGRLRDYIYDLNSAAIARDSLAETLVELAESRAERISVVAHSMGGWLFMETLRQLPKKDLRKVASRFETVVLAAPDIDVDAFEAALRKIGRPPVPYFVVVSRDDRALGLSRLLAGGIERVGSYSKAEELTELGAIIIDATDLEDGNFANHSKFADLAKHASQIQQVIDSGHLKDKSGVSTPLPLLEGLVSVAGG
ncbi:alpha/beta fold hydrolase [uncultured Roseibium sp.]|uniref:alpha/beta hydrolase n=1 Tax=uncultured Roseibium sp. TaxID=1936171 RepID=UPI00261DB0F1|nr:alpha/beta fold hydrolase [uncultured Roseibium sp.]